MLNFGVKIFYMSIFLNIMGGNLILNMVVLFVIVVGFLRLINIFLFNI